MAKEAKDFLSKRNFTYLKVDPKLVYKEHELDGSERINGESNLEKIINQFIMKYYKFENTNLETATLIAKGYLQFNDFLKYLKDYDFVQNAKFEVFSKAIKYFDNLSVLEIRPTQ